MNREFMDSLEFSDKMMVLQHELGHKIQKVNQLKTKDIQDMKMWNIALDICVNQLIELPDDSELGKMAATLKNVNEKYPHLQLEPYETSQYYYNKLNELSEQEKAELSGVYKAEHLDDYDLTEEEKEVLKQKLKEAKGKAPGNTPSYVEEALKILNKSNTNWRNHIRKFISTHIAINRKISKNRMNKRYGLPYEGTRLDKKLTLLIGVDTSGSVSDEMLKQIGAELNKIAVTGVDIILLQSDCELNDVKRFKKTDTITFKGRGGTSFVPFFEALKKHRDVGGMIVFSDMEVGVEEISKPNIPVLWVSTTDSEAPYDWGVKTKIQIDEI
jgi:predicted metal-dependent peptidase